MKRLSLTNSHAGKTLLEVLQSDLRLPREMALRSVKNQLVLLDNEPCDDPKRRIKVGEILQVRDPQNKPADDTSTLAARVVVHHIDDAILIVDKPAGLTTVRHKEEAEEQGKRAKEFLPPTLVDLLPNLLPVPERRGRIRAVHRLDKETSGLVVLARTGAAETNLGLQFRNHSIERIYLALVRGHAESGRIESLLVRDRGDGRRGSGTDGQRAVTHVQIVEKRGEFSLVECRLETGRTHQVRIHLGEQGMPLCGERIYDRPLHGAPMPDASGAQRPLLHAALLAVDHPVSGERIRVRSRLPRDMCAHG